MPMAEAALHLLSQRGMAPPPAVTEAAIPVADGLELLVDRFLPDEAADIFHRPAFHRLHRHRFGGAALFLQLRQLRSGRLCGSFQALEVEPGLFASPGRGSYGGFGLTEELTSAEIGAFIAAAEAQLAALGARRLELVLPPFCYAPDRSALLFSALCNHGYLLQRQELSQAIALERRHLSGTGTYANRKRLAKAAREGVTASLLRPDQHRTAYDVIVEARRKKNYSLSMSWPDIQEMADAFPGALLVFGAFAGGEMIASAICLRINARVLYVYSWGELPGVERLSPVTVIADRLYDFARAQDAALVDLGTSSIDGTINPGLFAFKKSLGAHPSVKLFLGKSLGWRS
jgi:hypothetical protein